MIKVKIAEKQNKYLEETRGNDFQKTDLWSPAY